MSRSLAVVVQPPEVDAVDLESLRRALSFSMSPTARDWSQLALEMLENGRRDEALNALRNARAICDGPTAARHLRAAAEHLGFSEDP
jgi:hypothetical protein